MILSKYVTTINDKTRFFNVVSYEDNRDTDFSYAQAQTMESK
jgi:hypothetical protein